MPACSCPICEKPVKPRSENRDFPFCGPRCKTIDLGKWMSEAYRIPADEAERDEAERDEAERGHAESDPPPKEPVRH